MNAKTSTAVFEWFAGLLIGLLPLLCHLVVSLAGTGEASAPDAWTADLLFVAITTSGLCAVTLFTRLAKGSVVVGHLKPHSLFLMTLNMVAFLLSGVLLGQVSAGAAQGVGVGVPIGFLILATASSLYFEILIAVEAARDEASLP